ISKLYLPIFIESGSLMKNAFITKITSEQIRKNVASLLNTSGGYLFCGIDENRKAQPILTHKDVIQFRNVGRTLLEAMFGELAKLVSIHFYRYDLQYIMVFKVESSLDKPVFIETK